MDAAGFFNFKKSEHLREKQSINELSRVFLNLCIVFAEKMLKILKKLLTFRDLGTIFVIDIMLYIKRGVA